MFRIYALQADRTRDGRQLQHLTVQKVQTACRITTGSRLSNTKIFDTAVVLNQVLHASKNTLKKGGPKWHIAFSVQTKLSEVLMCMQHKTFSIMMTTCHLHNGHLDQSNLLSSVSSLLGTWMPTLEILEVHNYSCVNFVSLKITVSSFVVLCKPSTCFSTFNMKLLMVGYWVAFISAEIPFML